MCIFLDANLYSDFFDRKVSMLLLHQWLAKQHGKIVYSDHPRIMKEIKKRSDYVKLIKQWEGYKRGGKMRLAEKSRVERQLRDMRKKQYELKSNDEHVIALCLAENVQVIVTKDGNLHKDYKAYLPEGAIYQNETHRHLLKPDTCP